MKAAHNVPAIPYQSPNYPHIEASYEARVIDEETGEPQPQKVNAKCLRCGAEYRHECTSGRVRERIIKFAMIHRECPKETQK